MKNYFIKQLHVCFAVIFILTVHTTAFCQTTFIPGLPPAAQEAINKGIIAAKIPDYPLAISYFEEARKIAPQSAEVFFNLGLAESKIPGRELRAICWFGAYLKANPTASNFGAVKEQLIQLDVKNKSNLSRFLITVQDAASEISKNDESKGLGDVTGLWLDIGDIAMAQKASALIYKKDEKCKSSALYLIVYAQSVAGNIDDAKKNKDNIPMALYRTFALESIADAQLKAGDTVSAKKTLDDAQKTSDRIVNDPGFNLIGNEKYLGGIASLQAKSGDLKAAEKTIDRIQNKYYKSIACKDIAIIRAKSGDIEGAQKTTSLITDTSSKITALTYIAEAQINSSDIKGGQKTLAAALETNDLLVGQFNETWVKPFIYKFIAAAQAKSGDMAAAQKTIDLIKNTREKIYAETLIAEAQIKALDIKGAQETLKNAQDTADLIKDESDKSDANIAILETQTKGGANFIKLSDWIKKLNNNTKTDDCPLMTEPFLDLNNYLKSLIHSEDAGEVFRGLKNSAEKIVKARNIVMQLLKIQIGN